MFWALFSGERLSAGGRDVIYSTGIRKNSGENRKQKGMWKEKVRKKASEKKKGKKK